MTTIPRTLAVSSQEKNLATFALAIQQLQNGRSNATGTVTLATSATTTTVTAPNCTPNSAVFLFQTTAHAGAELAAGGCYVKTSDVANGSFKITHASNSQADRTFFYVCLG